MLRLRGLLSPFSVRLQSQGSVPAFVLPVQAPGNAWELSEAGGCSSLEVLGLQRRHGIHG